MVGDGKRQQHIGEREEEECEESGVETAHTHNLTTDAVDENETVVGTEHQGQHDYQLHEIHARQTGEPFIEKVEGIDEKREKRMAVRVVGGVPNGQDGIGYGVET